MAFLRKNEVGFGTINQGVDLGKPNDPGRTKHNNQQFMEAISWLARTGAHWRVLSEHSGKWNSGYVRFNRGCRGSFFNAFSM